MHAKPGLARAIGHVKSIIAASQTENASHSHMLPSIRKLSRDAGVSLVTMVKAIKTLREQGLIAVVHGKGIRIGGGNGRASAATQNAVPESQTNKLWCIVKDRIVRDILRGEYNRFPLLPSIKEMAVAYGVDYRTIKKAFAELQEEQIISAHGKKYRMAHHVLKSARPRAILFFLYGEHDDISVGHRDTALLRYIETQCRQAGLSVIFIRYRRDGNATLYTNHQSGKPWYPRQTPEILGCLWMVKDPLEIIDGCCNSILSMKKPVAVLDVTGELLYPSHFLNNPLVRFFSDLDHSRPSRIVGNYLLRLGHRVVAFFSSDIDKLYAKGRLDGLRQVFAAAGFPENMRTFTVEAFKGARHYPAEFPQRMQPIIQALARALPLSSAPDSQHLASHLLGTMEDPINSAISLWVLARALEPLMEQAIKDEEVTAWVFCRDEEAIIGLDFLKRNGIAVPDRISVVGFNNTLGALKNGLTSYYHDLDAKIPTVLNYLTWPNRFKKLEKKKISIFDGLIMERRTTAPPKS